MVLSRSASLLNLLCRSQIPPHAQSNERLDADRVTLFQWDAATQELPMDIVPSQCCDFLFCVFMLSAVHPDLHVDTLRHMGDMLRPGGCILFRDYGIYDMRSLRFKPGQMVSPNYFLKGDGTTSYFFDSGKECPCCTGGGQCMTQCMCTDWILLWWCRVPGQGGPGRWLHHGGCPVPLQPSVQQANQGGNVSRFP